MDNSFKMYNDEESVKLKKYMQDTLTNINAQLNKFMDKYKQNPKLQKEIDEMIYKHQIYKSKKNIANFGNLIKKSGNIDINELEEAKAQTEMYKKRQEEIETVKNFVNVNYLKMLPDQSQVDKKVKALPEKESKKDNKKVITKEKPIQTKNVICAPVEDKTLDKKNDDDQDDIKIETIPIKPPNVLGKKRKNKKSSSPPKPDKVSRVIFKYCYICKTNFTGDNVHKFYSNLCKDCGDYNYSFRVMKLDFNGRVAVVTGGRVKIGYYIATKLLSYGCKVVVTSRFPKDTLLKFQKAEDYSEWKNNLMIYPIDFRIFESTVKFVKFLTENFPHIDILINNAAQTIRRTTAYYKYLLPIETQNLSHEDEMKIVKNDFINLKKQLESGKDDFAKSKNALVSLAQSTEDKSILPLSVIASQIRIMEEKEQPHKTMIGNDGQTYDFSEGKSSWNLEIDEVPFQEFTEVQIINTWTPYYLCVKLKPLMMKSPFQDKYIVNVSSVEGIFNHFKRTSHPHTNMAKAALNMMTRTCGSYYKNFGIYMTSVDTGWVSPMNEMNRLMDDKAKEAYEKEFCNVPLDELDGAMRVLHPIIEGVKNKKYLYGILLKDYQKSVW